MEDHPRIRGTNPHSHLEWQALLGSSPHTRDKFLLIKFLFYTLGIIPAYAGQMVQFLKKGR